MHTRRLITWLLGLWLGLAAMSGAMATLSFRTAGTVLKHFPSEAEPLMNRLGETGARELLRFQAAEFNRAMFEWTGLVTLGIGFVIAILLLFQNYSRKTIIFGFVLLLAECAGQFLLTPQMTALGRTLDFRSDAAPAERAQFAGLHQIFGAAALLRIGSALTITVLLIRRGSGLRGRRRGEEIDAVDDSDDGHIDR